MLAIPEERSVSEPCMRSAIVLLPMVLALICCVPARGDEIWYPSRYGASDVIGAANNLSPEIVVSTEADFAYDPKYIPQAVDKVKEGFDVVVGSRHVGIGKTEGWTLSRKLNHWVANKFFATWVAGVSEVYDHNGAFRAIKVEGVLDHLNFSEINTSGFGFFSHFLFKLTKITDKFYELPIVYKFRIRGESKVSFNPKYFMTYLHDVFEYILLSFKIRLEKINIR